MPLAAGQPLSFYEILGPLGSGAMGEVYRARDTRLEREVAIKVLPEGMAADQERLRRFEREARTLASVNHPNIAGIHGVDHEGDVSFNLWKMSTADGRLERITDFGQESTMICRQVSWSVDGTSIFAAVTKIDADIGLLPGALR